MKLIEHFVDGKNFSGNSSRKGKIFDPSIGDQTAEVKLASAQDVSKAIDAKNVFINGQIPHP